MSEEFWRKALSRLMGLPEDPNEVLGFESEVKVTFI
jgi:hypothetical protein